MDRKSNQEKINTFPEWSKKIHITGIICEECGKTNSHQPQMCYKCGGKFKKVTRMTLYTYVENYKDKIQKSFNEGNCWHHYKVVLNSKDIHSEQEAYDFLIFGLEYFSQKEK